MAVIPRGGWSSANNDLAAKKGYVAWAGWISAVENLRGGVTICGARNQRDEPCTQSRGQLSSRNGRCRSHGRDSLTGTVAGGYRHGLRVAVLPSDMQAAAQHTMEAVDALSGLPNIAACDGKLAEEYGKLESGSSGPEAWESVLSTMAAARASARAGDQAASAAHLARIDEIAEGALGQADIWDTIKEWTDLRLRLARGEIDAKIKLSELMAIGTMLKAMDTLADVFRALLNEHVSDHIERVAVTHGLEAWAGRMIELPNGGRDATQREDRTG